jgi:hypothetical protein
MDKLKLNAKSLSRCCREKTIIVLSRAGGYLTQNCSKCGTPDSLKMSELPDLSCGRCRGRLQACLRDKNYEYFCPTCNSYFELATFVPPWSDMFKYDGFEIVREP